MEDKVKKYLGYLPYIAPIIYFIGFIVVNGYLSNYGFSDFTVINFNYLKAGVLFSIILSINFMIVWFSFDKESMTDNLKKSWKAILKSLTYMLFINFTIYGYLFRNGFPFANKLEYIVIMAFLFYLMFVPAFLNPEKKRSALMIIVGIIGAALLVGINIISAMNSQTAYYMLIFNLVSMFVLIIIIGDYGDKRFGINFIMYSFFMLVLCFSFGVFIYGIFPSKYGGGEQVQIIIDNECLTKDTQFLNDTFHVIYENDKRFILKKDSTVYSIAREELKCFQILQP